MAQLTGLTLEQLPKAVLPAGKPSPSSLRQPAEMTAAIPDLRRAVLSGFLDQFGDRGYVPGVQPST